MWYYYSVFTHNGQDFATMVRSTQPEDLIIDDETYAFPSLKECLNHRLAHHSNLKRELSC